MTAKSTVLAVSSIGKFPSVSIGKFSSSKKMDEEKDDLEGMEEEMEGLPGAAIRKFRAAVRLVTLGRRMNFAAAAVSAAGAEASSEAMKINRFS